MNPLTNCMCTLLNNYIFVYTYHSFISKLQLGFYVL